MDFIGIGRQSVQGTAETTTVYLPLVGIDEERCEACGKVAPRETMESFEIDDDGLPMYRCAIACE